MAELNYAENKLDLAIYNYEKAVKIAQQFKDTNNLVAYQNNLKIVSAKCFCDKERITSPDSASRDKGIALNNKGLEFKNKGKPDKAIENYLKAFKIFKDKKLDNDLSVTYFNIGCAYQQKEEYDVAITYFSKSIEKTNADKLLSKIKDNSKMYNKDKDGSFPMHIARTYSNKGFCYRMKGDYNSAILNYEMAITIDEAMGCYREVMNDNNNLGIAHYFAGRFGQAAILLKKAAEIAQEFDDINNLVNYYCALGRTYISLNYNNTGYYYYDEAKKLLGKKNKKYSVWISKTIKKLKNNGAIIDPTMVKGATDKSVSLYTYQIEDFRQISEEYKRVILERDRELIVTVDKDILDDDISTLDTTPKTASKFDKKNVETLEFDETKAFGKNTKLASKTAASKTKATKDLSADPTKEDAEKPSSGKTLEDITGDNIPEHAPKSMLSYGEASEGSEIGAFRGGESKPSEDEQSSVGHEE